MTEVRDIRSSAKLARKEARMPGFVDPIVSYIPAYGAETRIRALLDYCRLRRMASKSDYFADWFAEIVISTKLTTYRYLHLGRKQHWQYREFPGEKYMGDSQLEHFRGILRTC
jgi:hypothetical protein